MISVSTLNVKVYDNTNIKNTYGFFKLVARIKPFFSIKNMAAELRFAKFLLKNKQCVLDKGGITNITVFMVFFIPMVY